MSVLKRKRLQVILENISRPEIYFGPVLLQGAAGGRNCGARRTKIKGRVPKTSVEQNAEARRKRRRRRRRVKKEENEKGGVATLLLLNMALKWAELR